MNLLESLGAIAIGLFFLLGLNKLKGSSKPSEHNDKDDELAKSQAKLVAEVEALQNKHDNVVPNLSDMTPEEIEEYWNGKNN